MKSFAVLCVTLTLAVGCRSGTDENTPDARPGGGGGIDAAPGAGPDAPVGTGGVMTIAQLNMAPPARNTSVTLQNVVIVASKIRSSQGAPRYGELYVQDKNGGMFTGMHIFCDVTPSGSSPPCSAAVREQIKNLVQGQVVTITGSYDRFMDQPPELKAPTITDTGMTAAVTPISLDAAMVTKTIQTLPLSIANSYVKINGPLTVSNTAAELFASTGTCTPNGDAGTASDAGVGVPYFGFEATAGGQTLAIYFNFSFTLDYCLPNCPGFTPCQGADLITMGETFQSVSGILDLNTFATPFFTRISPVTNADMPK